MDALSEMVLGMAKRDIEIKRKIFKGESEMEIRENIAERLFVQFLKDEELAGKSIPQLVESVKLKTGHDIPLLRVKEIVEQVGLRYRKGL